MSASIYPDYGSDLSQSWGSHLISTPHVSKAAWQLILIQAPFSAGNIGFFLSAKFIVEKWSSHTDTVVQPGMRVTPWRKHFHGTHITNSTLHVWCLQGLTFALQVLCCSDSPCTIIYQFGFDKLNFCVLRSQLSQLVNDWLNLGCEKIYKYILIRISSAQCEKLENLQFSWNIVQL